MTGPEAVVVRPRKIRRVCWVLAPTVVILFAVLGTLLTGSGGEGVVFQPGDQIAMIVLGLLFAGGILLFTRPKVTADESHIKIQNIVGGYDLPWTVVRRIRFDRGNPWVSLELEDDEVIAVMAVQAADKEHAIAATRRLRALHAAAHPTPVPAPQDPTHR